VFFLACVVKVFPSAQDDLSGMMESCFPICSEGKWIATF